VDGRPIGGLIDQNAVDRRSTLKSSRSVDDVARSHSLSLERARAERHQGFARRDRDANSKVLPLLARPVPDRQRGADSPLWIVLVGDRGAEQCHDRIADEFLDRPAVPFELAAKMAMVWRKECPNVLRVHSLGSAGESDEVRKEHGDDLPLLTADLGC
jgi:hypothetical protein